MKNAYQMGYYYCKCTEEQAKILECIAVLNNRWFTLSCRSDRIVKNLISINTKTGNMCNPTIGSPIKMHSEGNIVYTNSFERLEFNAFYEIVLDVLSQGN